MSEQVGHTDQHLQTPRNRFHPVYGGFIEWLDAEAPLITTTPEAKRRNTPPYAKRRLIKRAA